MRPVNLSQIFDREGQFYCDFVFINLGIKGWRGRGQCNEVFSRDSGGKEDSGWYIYGCRRHSKIGPNADSLDEWYFMKFGIYFSQTCDAGDS